MSPFKSDTKCLAALEPSGPLVPHEISIREPLNKDVVIDVKYAGICHSDIHQVSLTLTLTLTLTQLLGNGKLLRDSLLADEVLH